MAVARCVSRNRYAIVFENFRANVAAGRRKRMQLKQVMGNLRRRQQSMAFRSWQSFAAVGRKHKAIASVGENFKRIGEIEAGLQAETMQRHHEVEQINSVLG